MDKTAALQVLQANGESYDRARETLKHVSVDASGKVELEDWVEVCFYTCCATVRGMSDLYVSYTVEREAKAASTCCCPTIEGREGDSVRIECECGTYHQRG